MLSQSDASSIPPTSVPSSPVSRSNGQLVLNTDNYGGKAQQINVLHVVNGEHFSGAERVQSHLGRCLPSFGVAADFASVKPGKFAEMVA